jgi:hypothetical protein
MYPHQMPYNGVGRDGWNGGDPPLPRPGNVLHRTEMVDLPYPVDTPLAIIGVKDREIPSIAGTFR